MEDLLLGMNEEENGEDRKNKGKKKGGGKTNMVDLDMLTDEQIVRETDKKIVIIFFRKKWKGIKRKLKNKLRKRGKNGIMLESMLTYT